MAKKERPVYAFVRRGDALVPEMDMDRAALSGIAQGQRVKLEIRNWRNLKHHRLYWQMLTKANEATGVAPTVEYLHEAVKGGLGYDIPVRFRSGKTIVVPGSIAFESMTEAEFSQFFQRAIEFLATELGIDPLEFYERAA